MSWTILGVALLFFFWVHINCHSWLGFCHWRHKPYERRHWRKRRAFMIVPFIKISVCHLNLYMTRKDWALITWALIVTKCCILKQGIFLSLCIHLGKNINHIIVNLTGRGYIKFLDQLKEKGIQFSFVIISNGDSNPLYLKWYPGLLD